MTIRKRKTLMITTILLIAAGLAAILIGIFAYQFGLDNNAAMGSKRRLLVALGLLLLLVRPVWWGLENIFRKTGLQNKWRSWLERWHKSRFSLWLLAREERPLRKFMRRHVWIWGAAAVLVVILTSWWYLTAGTFTRWISYSRYYDRQADSFLAGQLSLLEQPPAALAQVKDIFNWHAREGIDYLWDASYYNGKYYLYWGPVPALVAAAIKLIHPGVLEDQMLVLLFISGLAAVLAALFNWLRKQYFSSAPPWTVCLFTLVACLNVPVFWLVNRPSVYEAAIASAQFFLILGIYAALRGIPTDGKLKTGCLIVSGLSLGCSVASRFSYVFTVVVLCLVLAIVLLQGVWQKRWKFAQLLNFALPLLLVAGGFAWFNYARFGSILETGMKYQLTGDALPVDRSLTFSAGYVEANVYSSLLRPLQLTPGQFPFFATPYILDNMWPNFVHRSPTYYSGEPVAGVLTTIPFLWLLLLLLINWIKRLLDWINERPLVAQEKQQPEMPVWSILLIALGAGVQLATNMSFVMTTMRYLADFTPLLCIVTAILIWKSEKKLRQRPGWRLILRTLVVILCLVTIAIGLLTNMQGADDRFENNNPQLYNEIATFFVKNP